MLSGEGEIFAMDSGSDSRSVRAGAQPGVQWTQQRRSGAQHGVDQEEPQVCDDQPWFTDVDDRPQQTTQVKVKCEYIRQPTGVGNSLDQLQHD